MKREERNSSIELLRILAMIGVVVLHYNNADMGGGFRYVQTGSINWYIMLLTENLFVCTVNLYVLISAYFLATTRNRRLIKIVELFVQVIVFSLAFYVVTIIWGGSSFSLKSLGRALLPANYFVVLYSVLYIISPYINVLLDRLDKIEFKKLLVSVVFLFSVWSIGVDYLENIAQTSISGLSTVGAWGSQSGYTIVNFVMIYIIGAYLRRECILLTKKRAAIGVMVCLVVLYSFSLVENVLGLKTVTWNYNNPVIVLISVYIFMLFLNFNIKNRAINELAKGAFTCFLFHQPFMGHLYIDKMASANAICLIAHQLGVAIGMYLISYVVYKIYAMCSRWFIKGITPLADKVDISL